MEVVEHFHEGRQGDGQRDSPGVVRRLPIVMGLRGTHRYQLPMRTSGSTDIPGRRRSRPF